MIANLLLIAYLIAMAYWWGLQGLFSAFLHLVITILAGAIAIAAWEPLVYGFLFDRMPEYAWGVGLLAPFILLMIGLRLPMDALVRKNVNFPNLVNVTVGGFLGVLSGIVSAGLLIVGLSFLPLGLTIGGYQPFIVEATGRVSASGGGLWVPVDSQAMGLFTMLSDGSLSSGRPMSIYRPGVVEQAALFRLARHYDKNASLVATPPSVRVTRVGVVKAPLPGLSREAAAALEKAGQGQGLNVSSSANRIVTIETLWQTTPGVFDQGTLYLAPVQMRLATTQTQLGQETVTLHPPIAFSRPLVQTSELIVLDSDRKLAKGSGQTQTITWTFVVPAGAEPRHLFARQLRLDLPEPPITDAPTLLAMLGEPPYQAPPADTTRQADADQPTGEGEIGPRDGPKAGSMPVEVEVTAKLPTMISKNYAQGLQIDGQAVVSGRKTVARPQGSISRATIVDQIWSQPHQRIVRVKLARDQAHSIYGASVVAAASLQQPALEDNQGQVWQSIGYVVQKADGSQVIAIDRDSPIRSARQLPLGDLQDGDELYLYFVVNPQTRITKYWYGYGPRGTSFDLNVPVE